MHIISQNQDSIINTNSGEIYISSDGKLIHFQNSTTIITLGTYPNKVICTNQFKKIIKALLIRSEVFEIKDPDAFETKPKDLGGFTLKKNNN